MVGKRSKRKIGSFFVSLFRLAINVVIVYMLLRAFLFAYGFAYQVFENEACDPNRKTTITFTIHKGASALNIAENLQEEGIIKDKYTFVLRYKFSKYNGKIKAGTYKVSPAMKSDDILAILSGEEPPEETIESK